MFEREINTVEEFADQVRLLGNIMGYGFFTIFIIFPIFIGASLEIHDIYILIYMVLFFGFGGFIWIYNYKIMISKLKFWCEVEIFNPLFTPYYFLILGGVISIVLSMIIFNILLDEFILNNWPRYLGLAAIFIFHIPIFYYLSQFRKRKFGGERLKYFRGRKPEIDEYVKKALDSLNLKYETVKLGSNWTVVIPYYKIQGYDLMVKVRQVKYREMLVATRVRNSIDLPKAKEIERAIDSYLSLFTLRT